MPSSGIDPGGSPRSTSRTSRAARSSSGRAGRPYTWLAPYDPALGLDRGRDDHLPHRVAMAAWSAPSISRRIRSEARPRARPSRRSCRTGCWSRCGPTSPARWRRPRAGALTTPSMAAAMIGLRSLGCSERLGEERHQQVDPLKPYAARAFQPRQDHMPRPRGLYP